MVRSSSGVSSSVDSGTPSSRQSAAVRSDVGTPMIVMPVSDLFGQQPHEFLGRGAGADAKPHAVARHGQAPPGRPRSSSCVASMRQLLARMPGVFAGAPSIFARCGKGFLPRSARCHRLLAWHGSRAIACLISATAYAGQPMTPPDHRLRPRRNLDRYRAGPARQPEPQPCRRRAAARRRKPASSASSAMAAAS